MFPLVGAQPDAQSGMGGRMRRMGQRRPAGLPERRSCSRRSTRRCRQIIHEQKLYLPLRAGSWRPAERSPTITTTTDIAPARFLPSQQVLEQNAEF